MKTSLYNKGFLLFVIFQLWGSILAPVFANPPVISYLGINQGLSNNSVRCIYQDQHGFMWFGTYDGLNRYDGYAFKVFRNNFKNPRSLVNNWINTVNEDGNGNIWVGTRQGLCFYQNLSNRFTALYYASPQNKVYKVTSIVNIIEKDGNGNMLVGTNGTGLLFYAKGDSIASTIPLSNGTINDEQYDVSAIKTSSDKTVYIFVRGKGFYTFDYKLKKLTLVNSAITSANCFAVNGNFLWVGANNGIHRYNTTTHAYDKIYNEENKKLNYKDVVGLTLDAGNKLWIATNGGGVNILDIKTDVVEYLVAGNNSSSLQSNSVNAILEDRQSRKWIGTLRGGINIIDVHKERFKTIVSEPASNNTLISNYIFSFYEAANGDLWVGTDGEGLSIWNRKLNTFTNHWHNPADASTISNNSITGIKSDYKGNIWVATYRGGVNLYNKETGTFSRFQFVDPKSLKPITKYLTYLLYEDNKKDFWAGTLFQGVFRLNRQKNIFELFDETLKDIFALVEDKSGKLWVGNLSQLIMVDRQNHKHGIFNIGKPVRSILEDRNGNFWIGTEGGGLVLFDRKQNKIVARYTTDEGLCSNSILNILEDEQGNLWMSTFNGISKFNIKSRSFKNYYQSDGLQSNQFNYNAALKLSTGELVFGGIKGFTFFKPEDINTINSTPQIFFTNIRINNNPIEQESSYIAKATNNVINSIRVPYNKAVLSFEFAALDYSAPEKIQYAFYLKGWDRGWTYSGNTRTATYTHLSEGNYTLLVKSTNAEGIWSANELQLT
ncbi:MAG: two-component regulator propeller domain-containing protein, partial [Ferruginibacter sp.]